MTEPGDRIKVHNALRHAEYWANPPQISLGPLNRPVLVTHRTAAAAAAAAAAQR